MSERLSDAEILDIFSKVDNIKGLRYARLMIEFGKAIESAVLARASSSVVGDSSLGASASPTALCGASPPSPCGSRPSAPIAGADGGTR